MNLNQEGTPPLGVNKFPAERELLRALQQRKLINKFTNIYTCFYNLFNVRGLGTKNITLREAWYRNEPLSYMESRSCVTTYCSQRSVWSIFSLERQPNTQDVDTCDLRK